MHLNHLASLFDLILVLIVHGDFFELTVAVKEYDCLLFYRSSIAKFETTGINLHACHLTIQLDD